MDMITGVITSDRDKTDLKNRCGSDPNVHETAKLPKNPFFDSRYQSVRMQAYASILVSEKMRQFWGLV